MMIFELSGFLNELIELDGEVGRSGFLGVVCSSRCFIFFYFEQCLLMNNIFQVEIVSKLVECILQSRLDVKKSQFKKWNALIKEIEAADNQANPFGGNVLAFLGEVLQNQFYKVRSKVTAMAGNSKWQETMYITILFYLNERKNGQKIDAETWQLSFTPFENPSFKFVSELFCELILFLNKKPLFSVYQKDKQIKSRFSLDYRVEYGRGRTPCILESGMKEIIVRGGDGGKVVMECSYLPDFQNFKDKTMFSDKQSTRKQSFTSSDYDADRKVSVYTFYDPDLDFTFLSSDDQSLKRKGQAQQSQMIQIQGGGLEDSDQFQLLMVSQDEQFLQDSRQLFDKLAESQKMYFF